MQDELLTNFSRELQDDVSEGATVGTLLPGLLHGPSEFLVNYLLDAFEPGVAVSFSSTT